MIQCASTKYSYDLSGLEETDTYRHRCPRSTHVVSINLQFTIELVTSHGPLHLLHLLLLRSLLFISPLQDNSDLFLGIHVFGNASVQTAHFS